MLKKIIIGISLGISSLLSFQMPEYQVTICDSSKNPAVINEMSPHDLSSSVVIPLKNANNRYSREAKIPIANDIKNEKYYYRGGNILQEPFEILEWGHSCSKHKYIDNDIIDSRVLFTYEKDSRNILRHTVYSPVKNRVFFEQKDSKYHFKFIKVINLNKFDLKDDEELIISAKDYKRKIQINNDNINLEYALRVEKGYTSLFPGLIPDSTFIKDTYQIISANNYGQIRIKKSDFDKNNMIGIEILGFFFSKGNNTDLKNLEKNNKELLIRKLNELFNIELSYRTTSSKTSSLKNILLDSSTAGDNKKEEIKDEIKRKDKNKRINDLAEKLATEININEEKKILDEGIHSKDELVRLLQMLGYEKDTENSFISLVDYSLHRFGSNDVSIYTLMKTLKPKNYSDLDKIKLLINKYKLDKPGSKNINTIRNFLSNNSVNFALDNYKDNEFLEKVFKRYKNDKKQTQQIVNSIALRIIRNEIDLEGEIINLQSEIKSLVSNNQDEELILKERGILEKLIKEREEEKEEKYLESSKEILRVYELLEKHGVKIDNHITSPFLKPKRFKFLSDDLKKFLYQYYNIADQKRSLERDFKPKGSQGLARSSEIIEYIEWFNYSIFGQIIKYLFLISLACYYYFDIKKAIKVKKFNKEKQTLIKKAKEFFHTNKINAKQFFPVAELTNISKKLDNLIKEYDKNYIALLKFGIYFKSKEKAYEEIKDTLSTLEKQIEKLLIEKLRIEEKYKNKEKEFSLLTELKEELSQYKYKLYNDSVRSQFDKISSQIDVMGEKVLNEDIGNDVIQIKKSIDSLIKEINKEVEEAEEQENILTKENPYEILGVSKDDNIKDIKRIWKRLSIKYHPDRHVDISTEQQKKFEELSKIINGAWDEISRKSKNDKEESV